MRLVWSLLLLLVPSLTFAHEVRPGFLELREIEPGAYATTWKVPARGEFHLAIEPVYPEFCRSIGELTTSEADNAFIARGRIRCERSLQGARILIRGLEATQTDVLVRVEAVDGAVETERVTPSHPDFTVSERPSRLTVLWTYFQLGVEHILTGVDHLLFVLCLVLLVRKARKLIATVTAFTIAHSITLAAATLGFVNVPAPPVEATIALSIVFLASEVCRDPIHRSAVTQGYPWLVAFSFGLLHGLGFAGALAEIGLPHGEIPLALFAFNVGVECGQLAFIAAVLSAGLLARVLVPRTPAWALRAAAYAVGCIASYWVFERLSSAA
ncbi:Hydrogenase/urease accessory protein HupE [Rhizobiales bacterium GAS191]|nr:Hydrogenase/urease accessory protein HupE [Rhizobiales bacterium GAS191]